MEKRKKTLGRSDIEVSAMGIGCWAIGGDSYGHVDDAESIRAIHCALDLGINLLDTANRYGHGHSEKVIGKALSGRRNKAVIATKFGYPYLQEDGTESGGYTRKEDIAKECEASLKRLNTDYIDLYQLHLGALSGTAVDEVIEGLEALLTQGKIRTYGWSTDTPENAQRFAALPHCAAIQYQLNLFYDNAEITRICEENGVSGLIRGPLAMGALTGKYNAGARVEQSDVRGGDVAWVPYFKDGKMVPDFVRRVEMAREILTRGGRTLAQGALCWLYAKSTSVIPIPGFKTAAQVKENAGALRFGPLNSDQMAELERLVPPMAWSQM
jgi:aryl-alcohol dehydrogenase-like predicted oxidoreductase